MCVCVCMCVCIYVFVCVFVCVYALFQQMDSTMEEQFGSNYIGVSNFEYRYEIIIRLVNFEITLIFIQEKYQR